MFFLGIFGANSKVVPAGQVSAAACPACGEMASLSVCRRYSCVHFFFIPLVNYDSVYLATCPRCASVFELDPALGRRLAHGGEITVPPGGLRLLRNNVLPRCPACGAPQQKDSLYCNRCGAKL